MSELKPCPMDRQRAIDILWAEILNNQQPLHCTRKELCDAVDIAEDAIRRAQSTNEPLTLEQLREMNGEPVWVATMGEWRIVCIGCENDVRLYSVFNTVSARHVLDNGGRIYLRKPEGSEDDACEKR